LNKRKIGSNYEDVAVIYLEEQGYTVLERNFRCRIGEIDIVARDGRYLVFIEVKYRRDDRKGTALEAVNVHKQSTIRKVAGYYLWQHHFPADIPCRFDVLGMTEGNIELIQGAF